jgi:S1-C subfamily serine protease
MGISLAQTPDGLQVTEVSPDSSAEKYGLRTGDIFYRIDKNRIGDITDFDATMGAMQPGDVIRVVVIRGERKKPLHIRI